MDVDEIHGLPLECQAEMSAATARVYTGELLS